MDTTLHAERAVQLRSVLKTEGWTESQFWEAVVILVSVPEQFMTEDIYMLGGDLVDEARVRASRGDRDDCPEELLTELQARWSPG